MTSDLQSAERVKTILWDFGGVFTGSPFYALDGYAARLGVTSSEITESFLGYGIPDGNHPWHKLERGEITMEEATRLCAREVELAGIQGFDPRSFFNVIGGRADQADDGSSGFTIAGNNQADEMFAGVKRLKAKGIQQIIVSNNIREFADTWRSMLPEELFDHIIDSSNVGVRKPDPAIFHLALEIAESTPESTVFLDDYKEHVEIANSMGIHGIVVEKNPIEALTVLENLVKERNGNQS